MGLIGEIMQVKFHNSTTKSIYSPNRIRDMLVLLESGEKLSTKEMLKDGDMAQIPKLFSQLPFDVNILGIENDSKIETADGLSMLGSDFKALMLMMYKYTRSNYFKPENPGYRTAHLSAAVPLPLVGYRNFKKRAFNDWKLPSDYFFVGDDGVLRIKDQHMSDLFQLDVLLGYGLSSTSIDAEGVVTVNGLWGLSFASEWAARNKLQLSTAAVRFLQNNSLGKRRGNIGTAYGCSDIKLSDYCASLQIKEDNVEATNAWRLYDRSCQLIRHLLAQRWCYYNLHRSDDMIGGLGNWDTHVTSINKDSTSMAGIQPKQSQKTGKTAMELFGL